MIPSKASSPSVETRRAAQARQATEQFADRLSGAAPSIVAEAERLATTVTLGVHGRRRPGLGENFWEYRPHQPHDGAARIDWRRSARSDELFVRENELEIAQSLSFWRDSSAGMDYASEPKHLPTKARRASVLTLAAALAFSRAGERVGALGGNCPPRPGRMGREDVTRALLDGSSVSDALGDPFLARGRGLFVLASDFLEPIEIWGERLNRLAATGVRASLWVISDPAEETFPFAGRTRFLSPEGVDEPLLFGRAQLAKAAYHDRYAAHQGALKDLARQFGWSIVRARTDRPAAEAFLAGMAGLAPLRR